MMRPAEQGFTLMETLVAFVILTVSLGVVLQIVSLSTRTSIRVADQHRALQLAQNQIDYELAQRQLVVLSRAGNAGPMRWKSEVERYEFPDQARIINDSLQPYRISVSVFWSDNPEQSLNLSTVRLQRQ